MFDKNRTQSVLCGVSSREPIRAYLSKAAFYIQWHSQPKNLGEAKNFYGGQNI